MDKKKYYDLIKKNGKTDYETYLNTEKLFSCQSNFEELCNGDELQFQLVHQAEEMMMRLISYTLIDIAECMQQGNTNKVITLFKRVHQSQEIMLNLLALFNTMSPKEYQEIRLKLGKGSGRESPGFKVIMSLVKPLWHTYKTCYLEKNNLSVAQIYHSEFEHNEAYVVAEALVTFDMLFQRFFFQHIQVVHRSIGEAAKSLSGSDIQELTSKMLMKLFPELWTVRSQMTDNWGQDYGYVRKSISERDK